MMGLKLRMYWVVHYLFDYVLYLCIAAFLILAGNVAQFRVFTVNAPGSYILLFLIWGHTLIAMSFLLSVCFGSRKTSLIVGYFMVVGFSLICTILLNSLIGDPTTADQGTVFGLSVIPPFALYRGLSYLADEVRLNQRHKFSILEVLMTFCT